MQHLLFLASTRKIIGRKSCMEAVLIPDVSFSTNKICVTRVIALRGRFNAGKYAWDEIYLYSRCMYFTFPAIDVSMSE